MASGATVVARLGRRPHAARLLAGGVTLGTMAIVLVTAGGALAGGSTYHSFGEPVPGFPLVVRVDGAGLVVTGLAGLATIAALADDRRCARETAWLLACFGAAQAVAVAGNLITMVVSLVAGNAAALMLIRAGSPRLNRSTLLRHLALHVAALGLVAVGIAVQAAAGTGDIAAIASAGLDGGAALGWGVAAAALALLPLVPPAARRQRASTGWIGIVAVPAALVVFHRLLDASPGQLPVVLTVTLASVGSVAALAGAGMAFHSRSVPAVAGWALCLALAGLMVAASGFTDGALRYGSAAVGVSLEAAVVAAPAWSSAHPRRWPAALALAVAGPLPTAVSGAAVIMELSALAVRGPGSLPLLVAAGVAAVLAAAAASLAAAQMVARRDGSTAGPRAWGAAAATGAAMAGALVPGVVVSRIVSPLAGTGGATAVDAGAVRGAGGGWAGGYILTATALVAAMVWSATILAAGPVPAFRRAAAPVSPRHARHRLLPARRRVQPAVRWCGSSLVGVDRWLIGQPGLVAVIAAVAIIALLLR